MVVWSLDHVQALSGHLHFLDDLTSNKIYRKSTTHICKIQHLSIKYITKVYKTRNLKPASLTGGMENWGLITYRDATLLIAADSIASERQYVASVVCHELAHQWFGDIVTMVYDYECELQ